jgi:hypothetical protein
VPFGLYSYGFGYKSDAYDAYGNMAGQSFFELNTLVDSLPPMASASTVRDDFMVTFRDDRVMDRGLANINIVNTVSLEASIPRIEPGAPQVTVRVRPSVAGKSGRLVLEAVDVAGNRQKYAVCYVFDSRTERYTFSLSDDPLVECVGEETWIVGGYASLADNIHTANFTAVGNVQGQSDFGETEGAGWGAGLLVGRRVLPSVILNGRLSIAGVGGKLISPDTVVTMVFDSATGAVVPYQEGTSITVDAPYVRVGGTAQWFVQRFFYLTAGFNFAIAAGQSATIQREVLRPTGWELPGGGSTKPIWEQSINALSAFGFELLGGLGFSYPISFRASAFLETIYTKRFGSMATDASWNLQMFGSNLGVLYRL